ncbi:LrgB family protein [Anaerotalea alkaliphila]|uniref:LrgB family protein n=1 Tax=Anaerotalea alkaliphila TaxID=2662126 RepID=A0A7X5KMT7_9FIRM|nr:LrgB family protein [Anaerotalea alkaliphila]NDL67319.1 LrgB family protein [Anaerotalea alkaliphila]
MREALTQNLYFGWFLSLAAYQVGIRARRRWGELANPMMVAALLCMLVLRVLGVTYQEYMDGGGQMVAMMVNLATVSLAIPLHHNRRLVRKHLGPILLGGLVAVLTSFFSIWGLSRLLGLDTGMFLSILPKSITTAFGVPLSEQLGGVVSITVLCIILTGILGAVAAPAVLRLLGVESEIARGVAIGGASHALGTSKALEMSETTGVMSSLSMVLTGILTVLLLPLLLGLAAWLG